MSRVFLCFFTTISLILMFSIHQGIAKPVGIHASNFFMLSYQDQFFYPIGVNTDVLLNLDIPEGEVSKQIQQLAESGINTLRLNVDHVTQNHNPVVENNDGTLSDAVVKRLDFICATSNQHQIAVIVSFFDLLDMAKNWETHPYHQLNGGECLSLQDFFTHVQRRSRSTARMKQLVSALKTHDNTIWEPARGINLDEYNSMGNAEWRQHIRQWTVIMLDTIQRSDEHNHLIALSFLPNTLPLDLMGLAPVSMYLLHIQSHDTLLAVKSTTEMLKIVKEQRRPVFIGELTWTGEPNQRSHYHQMMLWSMLAGGSSAFLHSGRNFVSNDDLEHIKTLRFAMPMFDLSGIPRPPANPAPKVLPEGSYQLIEHISGYEWIYCLIRKSPGKNIAPMEILTRNGWYEYQWFLIENAQFLPGQRRRNTRTTLKLQSPEFEEIIIGRLRFLPDREAKEPSNKELNSTEPTDHTE